MRPQRNTNERARAHTNTYTAKQRGFSFYYRIIWFLLGARHLVAFLCLAIGCKIAVLVIGFYCYGYLAIFVRPKR